MAAINLPNEEIGKIEKVGEKLKLIKVIEDVVSRKAREQDNARNAIYAEFQNRIRELERKNGRGNADGTPIKEAVYITINVVIFALLSSSLWQLTKYGAQIEEQRQQIEEYRGKISVLSSGVSELAQQMSKEQRIRETTDCSKVTLNEAKVMSGNGGLFDIYPSFTKTEVFCDLNTDGGGWTVFQRRMDGSEDFYRGWENYVRGFGNLKKEFWLGLETLHKLTTNKRYELRIDMEDWEGQKRFAKYSIFRIASFDDKYRLSVSGYAGDAGDSLTQHNGMKFSTKDRDHDTHGKNCAVQFKGAWWYKQCHASNFNSQYLRGKHKSYGDGINWVSWKGYYYSIKFVEMKIRPTV